MVENICKSKLTKNIYPPVFFVILNRGFDLSTPFLNGGSYGSQFFDVLEKEEPLMDYETEIEEKKVILKTKLNDNDPIWLNFKYEAFEDAMEDIMKSFKKFYDKN